MTVRERSIGVRWALVLLGLAALATTQALAQQTPSEARMRKDIFYLASDECEGRGVDTKGIEKAAAHIANEFKEAGLKPGAGNDSYFQPFTINRGTPKEEGPGTLTLKGPQGQTVELAVGKDFAVLGLSGGGKVTDAPLVFAGYGIVAPRIKYDDYKGLDVKGKVVIVIRRTPRFDNKAVPFDGDQQTAHASLERKFATAVINQAAAVILVNDTSKDATGDKLADFSDLAGARGVTVPALQVRRPTIDTLLQSGLGTGLADLEKDIDRDLKPRNGVLVGWTVSLEANVKRPAITAKNVIGVLEGSGPLANETVVVGAHYDHLGYGNYGSRGKDEEKGKKIHYGADDNGSGTTAVLELARRFAAVKDRQGRRMVFMTFSGEELGLLGSQYYCNKAPLFPLKDTAFMMNLDMVGRLAVDKVTKKDKLLCEGVKTGEGFEALVDKFNGKNDFQLTKKAGNSPYSDHASFYNKGVPILFYWTDTHEDYHRPGDTPDKINLAGMKKIVDMAEQVLTHFATTPERPKWLEVKGTKTTTPPRAKGPTLGFAPGYDEKNDGLPVTSVTSGRPAEKAGMKAGDKIVKLANRPVRNIDTYMAVMATLKAGEPVEVIVLRAGKELKLKVTPEVAGN